MTRIYSERYIKYANRTIFVLSLVIAALVTGLVNWRIQAGVRARAQEHLAQEVLRFHILANSDSEQDQALKLEVRDEVLVYLKQAMPDGMDAAETKEWVRSHADDLEAVARDVVEAHGSDDPVNAAVTTCWFPDRTYGDVTFPAGNYEALRIEIGAAKGHNWWCVLYPNLCFLDAANAVVPEEGKQELQNVLSEEEYSRITAATDFKISWYFPELLNWR